MSYYNSPFNPVKRRVKKKQQQTLSSIDSKLSRTNYYDGRLLKASDLIRDQLYLDERLREVGRAMGQGIVRGLEVSLSSNGSQLRVSPGLAMTASGRVLELEKTTLKLNLLDSASIAALNEGFRYLHRGLYAVVLQYTEQGKGSAEVYPKDLQDERGFHFNAFSEGVEVVLTPIHTRLPYARQHQHHRLNNSVMSRSALVRELILPNRGQLSDINEDGIALGLLAIENGRPVWLDQGLLRRAHRPLNLPNSLQIDLSQHYEELLGDVLELREQGARNNAFPASHYFDVLPPYGSVPKDCIDPVNGYQQYFPDEFDVSITPVRKDDIDAIIQQSLPLEPIYFNKDTDVDIMILVPMSNSQFSFRARQLQHVTVGEDETKEFVQPQHIDEYQLRAYGETSAVHAENTDSAVWQDIWDGTEDVYFVRRPTRVAETQVSAVVLATGDFEEIDHDSGLPPDITEFVEQIETLEEEVKTLEAANTELTEKNNSIPGLNATIASLKKEIQTLKTELAKAGDQQKIIQALKADVQKLKAQIDAHKKEIAKHKSDINTLNARIKKLEAELASSPKGPFFEFSQLAKARNPRDISANKAMQFFDVNTRKDPELLVVLTEAFLVLPKRLEALNWKTAQNLGNVSKLRAFANAVAPATDAKLVDTVIANLKKQGASSTIIKQWEAQKPPTPVLPDPIRDNIQRMADKSGAKLGATTVSTIVKRAKVSSSVYNAIVALDREVNSQNKLALWKCMNGLTKDNMTVKFLNFINDVKRRRQDIGMQVRANAAKFKIASSNVKFWIVVNPGPIWPGPPGGGFDPRGGDERLR